LREVDSLYLAGQTHPFVKIPTPGSKEHTAYQRRHVRTSIFSKLKDGGALKTYEIYDEFPEITEAAIRKELRECADFSREGGEGGHWTLKNTVEVPKEALEEKETPETVCMYDSLKVGQLKLKQMGITRLHHLDGGVLNAVQEIPKDRYIDSDIKNGALCLHETMRSMPWLVTSKFVDAMDGRHQLQLSLLVGSTTARRAAVRDESSGADKASDKGESKPDKKQQTDYNRKKQMAFQEMLETISQVETESSDDEEDEDEEFNKAMEQDEDALVEGRRPRAKGVRVRKTTIAHSWRKEVTKTGEIRWRCDTIRDPEQVAQVVQRLTKQDGLGEGVDERAKADARREKKRIQEKNRRLAKKGNMGVLVDMGDRSGMSVDRPREALSKVRIPVAAMEAHEKTKKRALPDHLQGRAVKRQRRRINPGMELNTIFEEVVSALWSHPKALPFQKPVDSRQFPDYRRIIKKPIDLNIIRTRCRDCTVYKSKGEFLNDIQLMVNNCKEYCQVKAPQLVSDVYQLQQICLDQMSKHKQRIKEAESMMKLAKLFESMVAELMASKHGPVFKQVPTAKDYSTFVKKPMDLTTMGRKAGNFEYCSKEAFVADVDLIKANCYAYCETRFPDYPPRADAIFKDAFALVEKCVTSCSTYLSNMCMAK
jgi:hypothetical protein